MRVGIIQSSYVPWRGYFDFIASVDVFVLYDTVQYSKGSWRNRNKLKTRDGLRWLTLPVRHGSLHQSIEETRIDSAKDWRRLHLQQLRESYRTAPFYERTAALFGDALASAEDRLSAVNRSLIEAVMAELGIETRLVDAREIPVEGGATERLVRMVQALGGTRYLSGPSASDYLDLEVFAAAGIGLDYKSYDYEPYPQLWGEFEGAVSVLDLLCNVGPEARHHVRSRTPDTEVVPAGRPPIAAPTDTAQPPP